MRKVISILLLFALLFALPSLPAVAEGDVLELDMWAYGVYAGYTGNVQENIIQDYITELTGVKISNVIATESMNQNEKFNLLYAADMMPAIIYAPNWNAPFLSSMDEADFCYRFSDEMLREQLPDLYARIPEITWAIWKRASGIEHDETMYIPIGQFSANAYTREQYPDFKKSSSAYNGTNVWSLRDDVLRALFPDAATYDELIGKVNAGETLSYDDLYIEGLSTYEGVLEAMYRANELFPDLLTVNNIDMNIWCRTFLRGTWYAQFNPKTMEVFSIAREYKDEFDSMLTDVNKLYNDGLVEPDFAILKDEQKNEYINAGAYAFVCSSSYTTANAALQLAGSELRYRPVLISYDTGDYVWDGYGMLESGRVPTAWAINRNKVSLEDLPRVLNYINYFFTDEGLSMVAWGPEDAGLWHWVNDERQWIDPDFVAVVNGDKAVGQMKDYDYYGINAVGVRSAQQPIFPPLFYQCTSPYAYSAAASTLSDMVVEALNGYNKGYWDSAYSAWNTTSATNNDFWQYWADMNDACKKIVVAPDEATFESELAGFYAIMDKVNLDNYLVDQGGYTDYVMAYSEGYEFHPDFVAVNTK